MTCKHENIEVPTFAVYTVDRKNKAAFLKDEGQDVAAKPFCTDCKRNIPLTQSEEAELGKMIYHAI